MFRTFIQVTTLLVVLLSSYFLIRGTITLSAQDLAELSKPKWGYHLGVAKNLVHQRSDTKIGFSLLLLSFFLQLINMLWPMKIGDFAVNKKGVFLAIIASILVFFMILSTSHFMSKVSYKKVESILKSD